MFCQGGRPEKVISLFFQLIAFEYASVMRLFLIAVLALVFAFRGRPYMIGFAVTFGIYVYYDLARYYAWVVSESLLSVMFLIATLAALASIMGIIKNTSRP